MKKAILTLMVAGLLLTGVSVSAEEEVLFSFEKGLEGWDIPSWAFEKPDHVQKEINSSDLYASEGSSSLEVLADFPGGKWTGAIVEVMQFMDWTDANMIACDVYVPEDAPQGLKASIILTVGDAWKWVEMSRSYELVPGEWITLKGDLLPGSIDWRRVQVDEAFRKDIRKLDVRICSNNKPAYTGSLYVDNVRLIK
ncbi:MAG: hypothetical protein KAI70_00835 [Candidatus Omnitrophica bacterium]|nr:hypothetical protein [Candidatus Omnitrophota bacterium]